MHAYLKRDTIGKETIVSYLLKYLEVTLRGNLFLYTDLENYPWTYFSKNGKSLSNNKNIFLMILDSILI